MSYRKDSNEFARRQGDITILNHMPLDKRSSLFSRPPDPPSSHILPHPSPSSHVLPLPCISACPLLMRLPFLQNTSSNLLLLSLLSASLEGGRGTCAAPARPHPACCPSGTPPSGGPSGEARPREM
eukprot:1007650-Pyramimonas_sp.AAC.1